MKNELGLIHCYTGDGKGKTTAALGLILRALGHHFKVGVVQFLKGVSYYGELFFLEKLYPDVKFFHFGVDCPKSSAIRQGYDKCDLCGICFVDFKNPDEIHLKYVRDAWEKAKELSREVDILILDEINLVLRHNMLPIEEFMEFIKDKPEHLELILTGRDAPEEVIKVSDYVTEMKEIKHPYEKGIIARRGIEY